MTPITYFILGSLFTILIEFLALEVIMRYARQITIQFRREVKGAKVVEAPKKKRRRR